VLTWPFEISRGDSGARFQVQSLLVATSSGAGLGPSSAYKSGGIGVLCRQAGRVIISKMAHIESYALRPLAEHVRQWPYLGE
jgi:hypothetical protein